MKLEMTTNFLHLIEPGTYGTNLGDAIENLDENYFDDFRNAIVEYGIDSCFVWKMQSRKRKS